MVPLEHSLQLMDVMLILLLHVDIRLLLLIHLFLELLFLFFVLFDHFGDIILIHSIQPAQFLDLLFEGFDSHFMLCDLDFLLLVDLVS